MPIVNPTATTGARSSLAEMTYVDPDRLMSEAERDAFLADSGVNGPFVADLLSEMLTHERCGHRLYRSVASRTHNPLLKQRYEEFRDQTLNHVEILEDLIGRLGGDPMYVSPQARATEKTDSQLLESTFLLTGSVDLMTQEMVMLNAVLLAETIDHANWSCLSALTGELPAGEARDAISEAVGEVEDQEDEHLQWAEEMRARMITLLATRPVGAKVATKAEELIAGIESLFD